MSWKLFGQIVLLIIIFAFLTNLIKSSTIPIALNVKSSLKDSHANL